MYIYMALEYLAMIVDLITHLPPSGKTIPGLVAGFLAQLVARFVKWIPCGLVIVVAVCTLIHTVRAIQVGGEERDVREMRQRERQGAGSDEPEEAEEKEEQGRQRQDLHMYRKNTLAPHGATSVTGQTCFLRFIGKLVTLSIL